MAKKSKQQIEQTAKRVKAVIAQAEAEPAPKKTKKSKSVEILEPVAPPVVEEEPEPEPAKLSTPPDVGLVPKMAKNACPLVNLPINSHFYVPETGHHGILLKVNQSMAFVRVRRAQESGATFQNWSAGTTVMRGGPGPDAKEVQEAFDAIESTPAPKRGKFTIVSIGGVPTSSQQGEGAKKARYSLVGHPVTAVLRYMGLMGWDKAKARECLNKHGLDAVSDSTIGVQLSKGKKKVEPPAELTKEQIAELSK